MWDEAFFLQPTDENREKTTDYRVFLQFSFQDPKREENPMFDRFNQDWCPRETRDVLTPKRLWRGLG